MQFREFHIIAAAAYAAETAANGHERAPWDEIDEGERNIAVQRVTAISRGDLHDEVDEDGKPEVFAATTQAILGFNGGQGGLALERIASIGNDHFNFGLVTEEQVAGCDIAEVNQNLLSELAGLRQYLGGLAQMLSHYGPQPEEHEGEPIPIEEIVNDALDHITEDSTVQ